MAVPTRRRRRHTRAVLAVAPGLLLAACSSDGGAAPSPTPPPAIDSPAPTTITSPAATTESPTTTATPTTTAAPTTTIDPVAALTEVIKKARLDAEQTRSAALADPSNADLRAAVAQFRTGDALSRAIATLDDLVAKGQVVRRNPDNPTTIAFEGELELPLGPGGSEAYLTECRVDTDVLYEVGTGPNGTDSPVNDTVIAERLRTHYVLEDGQWKITGGDRIGSWRDVASCPAG